MKIYEVIEIIDKKVRSRFKWLKIIINKISREQRKNDLDFIREFRAVNKNLKDGIIL
jgi:hypothetical protein